MSIVPAPLAFDEHGTPWAQAFSDVYHSSGSGPEQARQVFLGGNGLPARWRDLPRFTILETGFGLGLNFLASWQAWQDDPQRPGRLHFVSIEKHPFSRDDLQTLHASYPELAIVATALRAQWPPLVAGVHRLRFDAERVTLTLAFGDIQKVMPRLRLQADAIYLDGFAPSCNPEMWSAPLLKQLGRFASAGTTVATWSTTAAVREGLAAAGFAVERRRGFGGKRRVLVGRYAPRWPVRHRTLPVAAPIRHALVVGAGIAGAAITERLSSLGWRVELIEASDLALHDSPGTAATAGIFHPHLSRDDCILSRTARNALLTAERSWQRSGAAVAHRTGVLQIASDAKHQRWMDETLAKLALPPDFARTISRDEASELGGVPLRHGGWWLTGGWLRHSALVQAQMASTAAKGGAGVRLHRGRAVHALLRENDGWCALDEEGAAIASAPVVVLANAHDANRLVPVGAPMRRVRGQLTTLPSALMPSPRVVITGSGYVLPAAEGRVLFGSTYDEDDEDPSPHPRSDRANLERVGRMLSDTSLDPDRLPNGAEGTVGFRCVAPDRMPLIGALPDLEAIEQAGGALTGKQLADLPRQPGLYTVSALASRGLIWSALGAEMLGSLLDGEPSPIESDLADAVDPARFALRRLRQRG